MIDFRFIDEIQVGIVRPGQPLEIVTVSPRMSKINALIGAEGVNDMISPVPLYAPHGVKLMALRQKPGMEANRVVLVDLPDSAGVLLIRGTFLLVSSEKGARGGLDAEQIKGLADIFDEVDENERAGIRAAVKLDTQAREAILGLEPIEPTPAAFPMPSLN